jgi:hypothetical protein
MGSDETLPLTVRAFFNVIANCGIALVVEVIDASQDIVQPCEERSIERVACDLEGTTGLAGCDAGSFFNAEILSATHPKEKFLE